MSEPRTPQVPLHDENGEPFYPLTQYNQIVMPDNSRWDGKTGSSVELDTTLKEAGKVADAGAVGTALNELNEAIEAIDAKGYTTMDQVNTAITNKLNEIQNARGVSF